MQLIHGDIVIRSEQGRKTIWINQRLLVEKCNIQDDYLWKVRSIFLGSLPPSHRHFDILPDSGKAWRWARMNGTFYYALNRIPNRAPRFFRDCLPSEEEILNLIDNMEVRTKSEVIEHIKKELVRRVSDFLDNSDVQYFRFVSDPAFSETKAAQLAEAKAWCRMISSYLKNGQYKRLGINRKEHMYQLCTEVIASRELEGLRIKKTKSLRKKLHYFPAFDENAQRKYIVSGKYGNSNARKVGLFRLIDTVTGEILPFDIHETLMYNLYMNPGGPQKEELKKLHADYVEWLAEWTVESAMSYRTFCQYCSRFDNEIAMAKARHGVDYYKKHYLTYVPAEPLKYAHSLFAGDGSATVAYKYYDSKGRCLRMNLYVILISDVASRYIAGWAPAREGLHNETPRMVEAAVKMAVEAGGRQTMFEFVSDNHGAFTGSKSDEILTGIFNKVRTIQVGNSQANPAETQFRLFKKTLKGFDNFLRTSWYAGIESQANPDFIPDNESLPTYEEAIIQLQGIINQYNNKPLRDGSTPAQRFENKHPECKAMDARQLRTIFGHKTAVDISYMRGFVQLWKAERMYKFEIPDWPASASVLTKATGYRPDVKVTVLWDVSAADIYSPDGRYLMTCLPAALTSQAKAESSHSTSLAHSHHERRKYVQEASADSFENDAVNAFELIHAGVADAYNIARTDSNFNKESYNAAMEEGVNENVAATIFHENKGPNRSVSDDPVEAAIDKF